MYRGLVVAAAAAALLPAASLAAPAGGADAYLRMTFPNSQGVKRFDEKKLGLFTHWGPVSQWGTEISFPLVCTSFPCGSVGPGNTPITLHNEAELAAHRAAYAALAKTFNPTRFNATALAAIAYGAGFRYTVYTAVHCDGYSGWNSASNPDYNSVASFGRDIVAEWTTAFRAAGLLAGVYVCPSFWNNNDYWAPNASTAFGNCCSPNYDPRTPDGAPQWSRFVDYLHTQVRELTAYRPDTWWFDSGTYPSSGVDTHIETLVPEMRAANPLTVVHVRDGGVFQDVVETNDHSEAVVDAILGLSYAAAGDKFEVPGTLGEQWAWDPRATYKTASQVVRELVPIVAKGGNYLMNIGLDASGEWAPDALVTLANMTSWFAFNAEAIFGTSPMWPYSYDGVYFTQSNNDGGVANNTYSYALFFTGWDAAGVLRLYSYKPSLLKSPPRGVAMLTPGGAVPASFNCTEAGLDVDVSPFVGDAVVPLTTYFLATNATRVDRAPCATRDCSVYTSDGYAAAGVEGWCLTSAPPAEPTVAVKLWYNGGTDNMGAASPPADGQNWGDVDTECLVYANPGAGRAPLEVWHSEALGDYWSLASAASRAAAQAAGYTLVAGGPVGYVDVLGAPSVAAYTYVLRLEW